MRTTTLLFAALAGAALMGCGAMQVQGAGGGPTPTSNCKNTELCEIPVSVSACNVTIPANKKVIRMEGNYVTIIWQLDDQAVRDKYQFDKDKGVALDPSTPDNGHVYTGKQFSGQKPINNKTGFVWIDRNSDWDTYKYNINIVDTANSNRACPPLDPHFVNN